MNAELPDYDSLKGVPLQTFAASALFERTFDEGMELVEECARYLDGRGRDESRALPRKIALVYAGESMRVTTRLMQAASWLLIQRAVHEGDMSVEDASSDRYRLGAREICLGKREEGVEHLPKKLIDLLDRMERLPRVRALVVAVLEDHMRVARPADVVDRLVERREHRRSPAHDGAADGGAAPAIAASSSRRAPASAAPVAASNR